MELQPSFDIQLSRHALGLSYIVSSSSRSRRAIDDSIAKLFG